MNSLREIIKEAENKKIAIGHFNISDLIALKAIFESAKELNVPVIIGTSEGEANFLDRREAVAMVKAFRDEYDFPIFLNSDHTHSLSEAREAVEAGYDAVLFDAGKLSFEENIKQTKEAVNVLRLMKGDILIEGELGYIGSSSKILSGIPEGISLKPEDLTSPEQAEEFVRQTGVDFLAPAVGNIHGMIGVGKDPKLDIARIKAIKQVAGVPLVLHGGSGNSDEDFIAAIDAGISIIHINTEIRLAWRKGIEKGLENNPNEIAPYKVLPEAVDAIKLVVKERLKLFNKLV